MITKFWAALNCGTITDTRPAAPYTFTSHYTIHQP